MIFHVLLVFFLGFIRPLQTNEKANEFKTIDVSLITMEKQKSPQLPSLKNVAENKEEKSVNTVSKPKENKTDVKKEKKTTETSNKIPDEKSDKKDTSNDSGTTDQKTQEDKNVPTTETQESQEDKEDQELLGELTSTRLTESSTDIIWDNNISRKVQNKIIPEIPDKLKNLSGTYNAIVYIEVNKFGIVVYAKIEKSSGNAELDEICIGAAKKWTFSMISEDRIDSGKIEFIFKFN